jgi:hypothetical protein
VSTHCNEVFELRTRGEAVIVRCTECGVDSRTPVANLEEASDWADDHDCPQDDHRRLVTTPVPTGLPWDPWRDD